MSSTTFFFVFIPILAIILLAVNLIFAPHNPYQEKNSAFECGFHSFLGQNRTEFSISFFIFALLFLLFDLEILLVYPYVVSAYTNGIYGLVIMLIFFLALTLGFAFELGKNALKIDSRQMKNLYNKNTNRTFSVVSRLSLNWLKIKVNLILVNVTLSKFAAALFASIVVALFRLFIYGDFSINSLDWAINVSTGLLGWIANTSAVSLLADYLGTRNINFNLNQFLYGYDKMGGNSSSSEVTKPKLYNPMGQSDSLPISTEDDPSLPRRRLVEQSHPHYQDIMASSWHQFVLDGYISHGGRFSDYASEHELRSAFRFVSTKTRYLDSGFNTDDLSVANVQKAHRLLALHKLSLESRVS